MEKPELVGGSIYHSHEEPELQAGDASLSIDEPELLCRPEHISNLCPAPKIQYNHDHIVLHRTHPKILVGSTSVVIEDSIPKYSSHAETRELLHGVPEMIDMTQVEFSKHEPEILKKTDPILEKNEPVIALGVEATVLEKNDPIFVEGNSELHETIPIMTSNFDKPTLQKNIPNIVPGQTTLTHHIPCINIGKAILIWNIAMLRLGTTVLKHHFPLLTKSESVLEHNVPLHSSKPSTLEHNLPAFPSKRSVDIIHEIPNIQYGEMILVHNEPILME